MKTTPVSICARSAVLGAGVAIVVYGAASCSDVPMDCTVGRGDFNVEYLTPGCEIGNGDVIGSHAYIGRGEVIAGAPAPDLSKAFAALQPEKAGYWARQAEERSEANLQGAPYAYGPFVAPRPDANNFCVVANMTSHVVAAEVPPVADDPNTPDDDSLPGVSAVDMTYAWSNVRFYVTPGIQGLQFEAQLAYTNALSGCSASTKAVGVYPYYDTCGSTTVAEGVADPADTEVAEFVTGFAADDAYCGDVKMSGISSDYPVKCVAATADDYLTDAYACAPQADPAAPPLCTPTGQKVATRGFCFLEGAATRPLPIVKGK